jgi:predicted nucleotidyltransferase
VPTQIHIPLEEIKAFCAQWQIIEFSLFGSSVRSDFTENSDIDVLVTFAPDAKRSLIHRVHMINELKNIFGREVDLAEECCLDNPFRRRAILADKKVIHAA